MQDEASQLVRARRRRQPGRACSTLCASPGGKTLVARGAVAGRRPADRVATTRPARVSLPRDRPRAQARAVRASSGSTRRQPLPFAPSSTRAGRCALLRPRHVRRDPDIRWRAAPRTICRACGRHKQDARARRGGRRAGRPSASTPPAPASRKRTKRSSTQFLVAHAEFALTTPDSPRDPSKLPAAALWTRAATCGRCRTHTASRRSLAPCWAPS